MTQRFNSDTQALKEREKVNATGAVHNLEDWIMAQVHPHAGARVLDLGCGTGKQIFSFTHSIGPQGTIVGVDISKQAVDTVNERARQERLSHVTAVQSSLDQVVDLLRTRRFDLIVSSYAFYYAKDMRGLFGGLRSLLEPGGQIFVCGPGNGTNQEMIDLVNRFVPSRSEWASPIMDFMNDSDVAVLRPLYGRIATVRLQNQIKFSAAETLLQWWRNHNSYVPKADAAVTQEVRAYFAKHEEFVLAKNVFGIHAHV